jgi:CheY-like chemotaxis protein/HPt (histidine-containing phosphotransfer) domain-containing protein
VNLVGNAIKFTEKGEIAVWVEEDRSDVGELCLHFSVSDTGIGIPAEQRETIFHAFEQGDTSVTRRYGGTGLGLAISSRLVEMMGGRIWVESEVGVGTVIHFTARFEALPDPSDELRPALPGDMPVLVVDDNATNRRILEEMLKAWGLKPTCAEGGSAAVEILEAARAAGNPFPMVLLDRHMPEMDGFALAGRIKSDAGLAGATVMLLSSRDHPGDAALCRELGVAASLRKPVKPTELLAAIRHSLGLLSNDAAMHNPIVRVESAERRRPLRVLLVEDNIVNQKLGIGLLRGRGHSVEVAGNGCEALAALAERPFDLVLMDVQMPVMDGLEATAAIRRSEASGREHIPILAMTAHAMPGYREICLEAGMDAYVSKPIRGEELFQAIDALVPSDPADGEPEAGIDTHEGLDPDALLRSLDGNRVLLKEIAGLFVEGCPGALERIRAAVESRDARALEEAAHAFKGSISFFPAKQAFEAANLLEEIGREGDLEQADVVYARLAREVTHLAPALSALAREIA